MTSGILRVGIAGFGVVGKRRQHFIDANPNLVTVAVCDRKPENLDSVGDKIKTHKTYADLLDVLFVCLTNDVAAEVTVAGLERGLHVFCEKPPGRNMDDIARVRQCAAQRPGQKLKYGFNHRYHTSVQDALALIQGGGLGRVVNMRGLYGKSAMINFESDWRTQRSIAGGGILLDQGIHMVDLLRLFAGEFSQIHSFISNDFWNHDVEDNAFSILRAESGVIASLHSSATQWRHSFLLEITLSKGTIQLSGILSGSKSYGEETMTVLRRPADSGVRPQEETRSYDHDPSWEAEIAEFTDAILHGGEILFGSVEDAFDTMKTVYRIYCADSEWKARWDLTVE